MHHIGRELERNMDEKVGLFEINKGYYRFVYYYKLK